MDKTNVTSEKNNTSRIPLQGTRMIVAALLCFAGCYLYMPSADVIRTIPFVAVFAMAADVVYKKFLYNIGLVFVFSFSLLCLNGFGVNYALVYSLGALVFAAASVYGKRLLAASSKTSRPELKKRCLARAIAVLALCFATYMLLCGNVISLLAAKSDNLGYINKNYKDIVDVKYTDYDVMSGEYRTYISFVHEDVLVGKADKCYISENCDGRREYLTDVLTEKTGKYLKLYISEAVDMFEITNSGIYFDKGEVLPENAVVADYDKKAWYVVSLYHTVEDKDSFAKLCTYCLESLKRNSEFRFSEIVLCGGSASEVLYTFTVNKETLKMDRVTSREIADFNPDHMKKYGITEKSYLDYWQNK